MIYTIKEINPFDGILKQSHKEILGHKCYIINLQKNFPALIKCQVDYDESRWHRFLTTCVHDITGAINSSSSKEKVIFTTENTTYVLESDPDYEYEFRDTDDDYYYEEGNENGILG